MKRIAYLSVMFIALTLMSFSCEKENDPEITKTLEEQYPEWSNLSGIAPAVGEVIPTFTISIVGDAGTFTQNYPSGFAPCSFEKISINGSTITFMKSDGSPRATGTFTKNSSGNILTLKTSGRAISTYECTYTF